MLTSSLGWIGFLLPIAPPASSIARFEMTRWRSMLVWVPLPVCQTRNGNSGVELARGDFLGRLHDQPRLVGGELANPGLTWAAAFLSRRGADHRTRHPVGPDVEVMQERWVCAPQ